MFLRLRLAAIVGSAVVATMVVATEFAAAQTMPKPLFRSCATPGAVAPAGCWQQRLAAGHGGFPASPGSHNKPLWAPGRFPLGLAPRMAFNNELWMTAQTLSYSSPDGLTWTQHRKTDWGERIYHSTVYFKGKLWMYGGMDYEARAFLNDIWSSADGLTWSRTGSAAWSARGAQTMLVYRDKLWLFGGADHATRSRSPDAFLNDVWVSDDGLAWTAVTDAAPWSPRSDAGVVVFNDELYLVGGQGRADVWRSSDGRHWSQLAAQAPWKPRHGYAGVVFDSKLWVFGGWAGKPTNALNDVWYSGDGVTWQRQAEHAPWTPRFPVAIVFQDKIWIFSGKHNGSDDSWSGDLWQMAAMVKAPP
jgi:Kelch motif